MSEENRQGILAKMKGGVDTKTDRQKRTAWAMVAAAAVGVLIGLYRYRGKVQQALQSDMTSQGLAGQNYSAPEISRILAVEPWVEQYAADNNIDPDLVNGVIWVESRFQPGETSSAGARGLMQLMPSTQKGLEKELGLSPGNAFDPQYNIRLGTTMLRNLIDKWDGDMRLVLGSYNWGSGNVAGSPDDFPDSVESYVNLVLSSQKRFEKARG